MVKFVHVRDLKNRTSSLLREAEKGETLVVTRRGKPVATLKHFDEKDLRPMKSDYPTSVYDTLRAQVEARHPELRSRSPEKKRDDLKRLTEKIRRCLPFKSWQQMDRAAKGDRYGLAR